MNVNVKIKSIKTRKKFRTLMPRIVILFALCFVSFLFALSYIRYRQCLSENERLRSLYADLMVKIQEIEENAHILKGANGTK